MRGTAIALLWGLSAGCTAKAVGQHGSEAAAPASSVPGLASSRGGPAPVAREPVNAELEPSAAFLRAVRELDWASAATRFDQLSSEEQQKPELCFARAYC